LEAAFWYARSDAAHLAQLQLENDHVTVALPPKREKSVAAVYLANCAANNPAPLLDKVKGPDLWEAVTKHVLSKHLDERIPNLAERLEGHIESYLEVQLRDHQPLVEVAHNVTVTPIVPAPAVANFIDALKPTATEKKASVDSMVSTWVQISGANSYLDPDEVDELVEWMEEHMTEYVDNKKNYIATYSKNLDKKKANELYDEWSDRKDGIEEEDAVRHRGEIM
jgi:hypothetical protein